MARQSDRSNRTRARLIEAAADCFVTLGYHETSLDAVLLRAEVSKGALYHHFASKADLLEAVFGAVSRETIAAAARAAVAPSPREMLALSLKSWLRAARSPRPQRILLDIGPQILGYARARAIEVGASAAGLRALIDRAVEEGEARCVDPDLTVPLLNAAVTELALTGLEDTQDENEFSRLDAALDALIDALLPRLSNQPSNNMIRMRA